MGLCFGNQIVVGMPDDLDARELARTQSAAHVNAAIDARRVGFASGNKEISEFEFRIAGRGGGAQQTVLP